MEIAGGPEMVVYERIKRQVEFLLFITQGKNHSLGAFKLEYMDRRATLTAAGVIAPAADEEALWLLIKLDQSRHDGGHAGPVATSSSGLGFRSFSPVASNSVPPASSSLFLTEDDLPPSNQLEVSQTVPETMLPSNPGAMILPEVTLPLNTLQVNTAYSLLRTLRLFCCENPGVLDTISALVQLSPVGDAHTVALSGCSSSTCLARSAVAITRSKSYWRSTG